MVVGVLGIAVLGPDAWLAAWRRTLTVLVVPLLWFIPVGGGVTAVLMSRLSLTAAWLCHMQQTREIFGQWWKAPARGFWR